MYQKKLESDIRCPLEYGLELFGGKWKSRVICVLNEKGTLRYSSIRKEMLNITDAVLSATLKELIRDGLVTRRQYDEIPPRVEYALTDKRLVGGSHPPEHLSMGGHFSAGKQRQADDPVSKVRLQQKEKRVIIRLLFLVGAGGFEPP